MKQSLIIAAIYTAEESGKIDRWALMDVDATNSRVNIFDENKTIIQLVDNNRQHLCVVNGSFRSGVAKLTLDTTSIRSNALVEGE